MQKVFAINLFGTLHVTQALLPYFRVQGSGTVAFTGAGVAWAPLPFLTHYSASKAALDIFVKGIAKEVREFGIRCVIFESGGFASKLGQPRDGFDEGFGKYSPAIADYNPLFNQLMKLFMEEISPYIPGDVSKIAQRTVAIIRGEGGAGGKDWPVRVIFGSDFLHMIMQKCTEQLILADDWEDVSLSTDSDGHNHKTSKGLLRVTFILEPKDE